MSKAEVVVRDGLTIEDLDEQCKTFESLVEENGGESLMWVEKHWYTGRWGLCDWNENGISVEPHEDLAQVAKGWLECFGDEE